jgi:hypothetical protein
MCIFTGGAAALQSVTGTSIFARALADGRQILVYGMKVAASEPLAMVLPLPVPPGAGAVERAAIAPRGRGTCGGGDRSGAVRVEAGAARAPAQRGHVARAVGVASGQPGLRVADDGAAGHAGALLAA